MREIRFRAWTDQGTQGTFRVENDIGILPSKHSEHWLENGLGLFLQTGSSHKLMQYTGLKDKNGKEIFEGDIIESVENGMIYKINDIIPLSRHASDRSTPISRRVDKEIITSNGIGEDYNDDWISNPEFYEIIGNIYENPELLN